MVGVESWLLRARVARAGFRAVRFRYRSVTRPIAENAARLAEFTRAQGPGPVHFVCHSLGGLVVLRMLRDHPELPAGRVVLIGSPVRGSGVAAQLVARNAMRWVIGRAADEALVPGGPPDWRVRHAVGLIVGTQPVGIGRLLGGVDGVNDGTVSAAETRLEGAADRVELPHTHTTLLFSRRTARQVVAFLEHGRFAR